MQFIFECGNFLDGVFIWMWSLFGCSLYLDVDVVFIWMWSLFGCGNFLDGVLVKLRWLYILDVLIRNKRAKDNQYKQSELHSKVMLSRPVQTSNFDIFGSNFLLRPFTSKTTHCRFRELH